MTNIKKNVILLIFTCGDCVKSVFTDYLVTLQFTGHKWLSLLLCTQNSANIICPSDYMEGGAAMSLQA